MNQVSPVTRRVSAGILVITGMFVLAAGGVLLTTAPFGALGAMIMAAAVALCVYGFIHAARNPDSAADHATVAALESIGARVPGRGRQSFAVQLIHLNDLYTVGALSDDEFRAAKALILS
jgi:hypothetical protein